MSMGARTSVTTFVGSGRFAGNNTLRLFASAHDGFPFAQQADLNSDVCWEL